MNWEEASQILGVPSKASKKEIHDQYLYKVQILHPDGNVNKPLAVRLKAEEELKKINEAYNVLNVSANNPFTDPPKLDISPKRIRFKEVELGERKRASFLVKSIGGAYSKFWIDDSPEQWLRVTDVQSKSGEILPLEVRIEVSGIGEPGRLYACDLAMRLESDQMQVNDEAALRIELRMKDEPGVMKLSLERDFRFKNIDPKLLYGNFEITNIGRGPLRGHFSTTRPWLQVSPDSITISPSETRQFMFTLDARSLLIGYRDKAYINIITNGGNERISMDLSAGEIWQKKLLLPLVFALTLVPLVLINVFLPRLYWNSGPVWWLASLGYLALAAWLTSRIFNRKTRKK
jgi:hypothetical protein